jgi:2-succinyl-6-hydroxy-2,4-cyclohexadiene-1-carboxylate synthase
LRFLVNGVNYHIELCGEGFPVLCLHGFTGRGSNWQNYCSALGKSTKLIMPDLIGHGMTDSPQDIARYRIECVAKDMVGLLDQLGFEKVDILGYSMGGRLAISMALLYPERVRKLILESASPGLFSVKDRRERKASDQQLAEFIQNKGMVEFVDLWENIPLFQTQKTLPAELQSSIRLQRLANQPTGLINSLLGMGTGNQPSYWEELHTISAEVLLIVGELDIKFCQIAVEMQKKLQKGKIYKVDGCGHAIHVEQSEKFGTIVSEFLSNTS